MTKYVLSIVAASLVMAVVCEPVHAQSKNQRKLAVFVQADTDSGGFMSPRMQDSLKDVSDALKRRRNVALAGTRDAADVVLRLVESGYSSGPQQTVATAVPLATGGAIATATTSEGAYATVCVVLEIDDYRNAFCGLSQWSWRDSAGQIGRNFDEWVRVNRAAIDDRLRKLADSR